MKFGGGSAIAVEYPSNSISNQFFAWEQPPDSDFGACCGSQTVYSTGIMFGPFTVNDGSNLICFNFGSMSGLEHGMRLVLDGLHAQQYLTGPQLQSTSQFCFMF